MSKTYTVRKQMIANFDATAEVEAENLADARAKAFLLDDSEFQLTMNHQKNNGPMLVFEREDV